MPQYLPVEQLELRFLEAGGQDEFPDGWTHRKTVPYTILARVRSGHYEVSCPWGREFIMPGEAFLTAASVPLEITHHCDAQRGLPMASHWVHFHFTCFETVDFASLLRLPLRLSCGQAEPFAAIIEELRGPGNPGTASALLDAARTKELAYRLLRLVCEVAEPDPDADRLIAGAGRLLPVLRHIRTNLAEPMTVAALARLVHLSEPRLYAVFKETLGCSPIGFVRTLRLNEARHRLSSTDAPVAEIAAGVGFPNAFHFSREFRGRFSMSPTEYRKLRREQAL